MIKILFLCHGNICRSPMAEFIMKDLVKKANLEQSIQIESAATSTEEIGNPVYPPARRKLSEHGIDCSGKRARQLLNSDYEKYDLLIGMDQANLRNMYRICGGDYAGKMHLLLDFTDRPVYRTDGTEHLKHISCIIHASIDTLDLSSSVLFNICSQS